MNTEEDPEIIRLEHLYRIHRSCAAVTNAGNDGETLIANIVAGLQKLDPVPVTATEVREIWNSYQARSKHGGVEMALDYELFTIEQAMQRRQTKIAFEKRFGALMELSPIEPRGITGEQYLRYMVPQGNQVIVFQSCRGRNPRLWNETVQNGANLLELWYWPFPVTHELGANIRNLERSPEVVGSWNIATTVVSMDYLPALIRAISSRQAPVRSVVTTNGANVCVSFRVRAEDKLAWNTQCRLLKKELELAGIKVPGFRYDWIAHLPHEVFDQHVVYLDP